MKQLCSSSDLRELTELVKRLVRVGIPCAVCKDGSNSHRSVWIQQDNDFPLALKIYAERDAPRPVPPWASLLGESLAAPEDSTENNNPAVAAADEKNLACVVVVQMKGATVTGTAEAPAEERPVGRTKR